MTFYPWTEIEQFHNIRKYFLAYPEVFANLQKPTPYKSKVKLHGTNAAIQVNVDGDIVVQSRSGIITSKNDNVGFAKWVEDNKSAWLNIPLKEPVIFFGEWFGPGVQTGVACSDIKTKSFAIFAAMLLSDKYKEDDNTFIIDPKALEECVGKIDNVYVLPYYSEIEIDWSASDEELQNKVDEINKQVQEVEKCDPWVKETFGVEGVGEGLVFSPDLPYYSNYKNFVFKAKGSEHRVIKAKAAAQVNPNVSANVEAFVAMFCTEARLQQGAKAVSNGEMFNNRFIGPFVKWMSEDIKKESKHELEVSNLKWEQVSKQVETKSRTWYIEQVKKTK